MADPIGVVQPDIDGIIREGQEHPITKALNAARDRGEHPMLRVVSGPDGATYATLNVGSVSFYFHGTTDRDGKRLEPTHRPWGRSEMESFIAYDGWERRLS